MKPLEKLQTLLNKFEHTLEKQKLIWKQIERDNPNFDPVSEQHWQKNQARCWLYGTTDISELQILDRPIFDPPSDLAQPIFATCSFVSYYPCTCYLKICFSFSTTFGIEMIR